MRPPVFSRNLFQKSNRITIVHSLSEPKVLNWVACGLWGMSMDLSGVAEQLESAELMSALVFDGGGWQ